jgi:MFS family permease
LLLDFCALAVHDGFGREVIYIFKACPRWMMLAPDATTPGPPDETSPRYAGWRVVLACFLMALFVFGFALYGQGVYLVELQRLNGWSASLIAGGSTLSLLLGNMLVVFTSEFVTRLGLKRLVLLGIAALAGSMALLAFASAPWLLYAAFMLMSLGWTGMGTVVIATVMGLWFVNRRGLAISLAFTGASSGGIVITPLLVLLVEQLGFQAAMLTAAAIMVAVLLPVVIIWIDPPPTAGPLDGRKDDSPRRKPGAEIDGMSRLTLMRQPAFWTITLPFALALTAQVGFIVHQIAMLEPKIGHVRAGFAVALMTFMAVAGRLGLGIVIDRFNPRLVTAALLASQAAALLTILLADNMVAILAACAVFGFSVGNLITLPPLVIHREFDAASFAVATGLSTAISGTVCALGPALIGLVRGWSGNYDAALLVCVAFQLAAAAIVARRGFLIWQAAPEERG